MSTVPSNKNVIDIWRNSDTNTRITKDTIENKYPGKVVDCNLATLSTKVRRLSDRSKLLKKNKNNKELESLMSADFEFPRSDIQFPPPVASVTNDSMRESERDQCLENKKLKRDIENVEATNENLVYQITNYEHRVNVIMNLLELTNTKMAKTLKEKHDASSMKQEVKLWEEKYAKLESELESTVEELHEKKEKLKRECTRNVTKKLKQRDETIILQERKIKEQGNVIDTMKDECEMKDTEMENLKRGKKSLLVKVCRLRQTREKSTCILENDEYINSLKSDIVEKENKIDELEQINVILQDPSIDCFHDGKYSNEIRTTIMSLLTEGGVSQNKVNHVMQLVLQNLTGKTLSRLPSTGVKSRLMLEAKRIANRQVVESMLHDWDDNKAEPSTGNTLHQDGTSTFHRHFQSYQVTTADGTTLSAGLSEVARGDASTVLSEFQTLVSDLASSLSPSNSNSHTKEVAKLIVSIIATMSDQGSVNPVFNDKLQTIREDLLPVVFEHWDTIPDDMKQEMSKLLSFFCKMHIFVNMASETDKCLAQFEKHIIAEGRNPFSFNWTESGASRLVRTVSKALTSHGCEKSGVGSHFLTYLQEKGKDNKLISFRGHRFNHLFHVAGVTYYHLSDIKDFLQRWADPNDLLKSIRFDIDETVYVSGIRALGIIDKVVTGPLWRLIEAAPNVLALNNHLHQVKMQLEQWAQDASPVLSGVSLSDEDEVGITKDAVYDSLFAPSENLVLETYTQMALELCFGGMLLILERQAKDQLPGGRYWDLDPHTVQRMSSVPTTNTASERDFAQLDILMRTKPSASTVALESIIMWSNNKTSAWLSSLSEADHGKIVDDAKRNAPHMAEQMKLKQQTLYAGKLQHLKERQEKKVKQEEKTHATKVKLTQKITEAGGLWTSEQQLHEYRSLQSDTVYKEALVSQIYFHKSILGSKGPKELFQQQHKGKIFSIDQLEEHLKQILILNEDTETEVDEPTLSYRPTEEVKQVVLSLKTQLKGRIEEGRFFFIISQQKNQLPLFIKNPSLLEGKSVKHKCRDPESREIEWYSGVVLHTSKHNANPIKTVYTIKYHEDPGEWDFPLLKDFENGDLIIVERN